MKETKVYTINGTPLFKFQDKEKINSLREGTLYAKTLKYYRDREQETGDADIGDEFEAMIHINKGHVYIPDTSEIYSLDDTLIRTIHSDDYVFCMFGILPNTKDFKFSEVQKEKMVSFGDTALLILNHDEFIRRVVKAAHNIGYKVYYGKVQYYNPDIDGGNFLPSLIQGMWKIAFWKRKRYSYQQEYRFLFVPENRRNKSEADHITLNLGDLSDITEVVSSNQALTFLLKDKRTFNMALPDSEKVIQELKHRFARRSRSSMPAGSSSGMTRTGILKRRYRVVRSSFQTQSSSRLVRQIILK